MTLLELLKQIRGIESRMITAEGIPLKMFGKDCQVKLELCGDNGNYWVEVRPSIDYDEKVAIIMQMFEDGTNDNIAMAVANQIKQRTIDKAWELIEKLCDSHNIVSIKNGKYKSSSWLEEQFRKAMEE